MGAPWVDTPSWAVVERLSAVLGRDLAELLVGADAATLQLTRNAQAATFALSLVALDRLRAGGVDAEAVAGHSLGEYTALVAAGALGEGEAMRLVGARGDAMQAAADANPGTMAAVLGLEPDAVADACAEGDGAWVANDNAPGQIVIAGTSEGVGAAGEAAKRRGATRVLPLAVGGAFHSPLMAPAQPALDAALASTPFATPELPVVANVDAGVHADDRWRPLLSAQLCQPVRWRQSLTCLAQLGATEFVELGPGDALTGMVKRTLDGAHRHAAGTPEQVDAVLAG
jgi:[acyl-carrier-protein] S-malonyltransferase